MKSAVRTAAGIVRRAVAADAPAACEVVRRSIAELCVDDHRGDESELAAWLVDKTPEHFESWILSDRHVALAAERNGVVVGFALLDLTGVVALLYVSPDARFSGVSRSLLTALEREARAAGIVELRLESTRTARRFYEAAGYSSSRGSTRVCGATSCYPMSRNLAAG